MQNQTKITKQTGQAITIIGSSMDDIEQSWEEVRQFVEQNLIVTKSVELSYGCIKFLQMKHGSYLQQLRQQCEIQLPSMKAFRDSASISVKGKIKSTSDVISKLKKFCTKCHVESFTLMCPRKCARFWENRWAHFSGEIGTKTTILVDFTTTQVAPTEAGKNSVMVMIVGTDLEAVSHLKQKVLKDENSSLMAEQKFVLPVEQFQFVSSNLQRLQLKLEASHSTVLSLNKQKNIVHLQAPTRKRAIFC